MKTKTFRLTDLVLVFVLLVSGGGGGTALRTALPMTKSGAHKTALAQTFGELPLLFIQNRGQMDSRVDYYIQGQDTSIYFASDGLTFALSAPVTGTLPSDPSASLVFGSHSHGLEISPVKTSRWSLKLDFIGANPGVIPQGEGRADTVVSYFKGSPDQWQTGLPTYTRLVYPNLWPGIDLVYSGSSNTLKYEFEVKPGADPNQIRLAYRGLSSLKLDEAGQMEITTPIKTIQDQAPTAYQVSDGKQVPVRAKYQIQGTGRQLMPVDDEAAGNTIAFSFQVSGYDPALPLVIDPAVLVYCGYIGGSGDDGAAAIALDTSGAAYVTGWAVSNQTTFPVVTGPDLTYNGGNYDAFVAKIRPDGTGLVYAGYIGGSLDERGSGIAVGANGAAYITGWTDSDQTTFPVKVGPDMTFNGGSSDIFVAKVRPDGTGLVYAGYIGGSADEGSGGIAIDGSGAVYVTGSTNSDQSTFPIKIGPDLTYHAGDSDAFVAKVGADGKGLVYAGYIGGSSDDYGHSIAVDGNGAAYVTGETGSNQNTFPVVVGPDLTFNYGGYDAYIAKVRPDGTGLAYAGYIGGNLDDGGGAVAVDGSGSAYVTGWTASPEATFPVSIGPDLTFNGVFDVFVAKLTTDGTGLVYAGYIGGSLDDTGFAIVVDGGGAATVTGYATSDEASFPIKGGPDLTYNGSKDAFLAEVSPDGTGLVSCGYIGGSGDDWGRGVAVGGNGAAYVTGWTASNQTTFPEITGPDLTYNGGTSDTFVAKIFIGSQLFLPLLLR